MTDWVVRRWARYGHDRLYAETPGGTPLGYLDLKTGRYHTDELANLPLLKHAIAEHRTPRSPRTPAPEPYPPAPSPDGAGTAIPAHYPASVPVAQAPRDQAAGWPASAVPAPVPAAPAVRVPGLSDRSGSAPGWPAPPVAGPGLPAPPVPGPGLPAPPVPAPAWSAPPAAAPASPAPPVHAPAWQDLSTNQPGAAARERALAERKAQGRLRHWFARFVGAKTDERAWRIGADGELAVAQQLATLDPRWHVLHAVPVGDRGSDIDHVVIGPAGVFTVNAKHHPTASVWVGGNTFMVNGRRVPYIRNSRYEALRAAKMLTEQSGFPVTAVGIIAVMGASRGMTVKKQPEDGRVVVVQRRRISHYLNSLPARLTVREIEVVYDVARRSTTWR